MADLKGKLALVTGGARGLGQATAVELARCGARVAVADRKTEAANQLWEVYQARQERLDAAGNGVNPVVWLALLIGTGLSLLFPYLFGGPNLISQLLITITLSSTLVLLLFAIYQMQNPFSGGVHIPPDAFSAALDRLN